MRTTRLTLAFVLLAAACGDDSAAMPDAGTAPDAAGPPPTITRWGGRLWGHTVALTRDDRALWLGNVPLPDPDTGATLRGGLARLDLDTGELRVFDAELPADPSTGGPVATGGVLVDGARRLIITPVGVLSYDGTTFTLHAITPTSGQPAQPSHGAIDRGGGRAALWLSTDQGLLQVDPDSFAVTRQLADAELGSTDVGPLALDPSTGAVFVAVHRATDSVVARVDGATIATLTPGQDGVPAGAITDLLFSPTDGGVFVALNALDPAQGGVVLWDGVALTAVIAREGDLAAAVSGTAAPFGTALLALDDTTRTLIVGGRIGHQGPFKLVGGGLVYLDLASIGGTLRAAGLDLGHGLPGSDVGTLAVDASSGRVYADLSTPCDEAHLRNLGLFAISFDKNGGTRLERPILSGVRALLVDGDETLAALRDDNPGIACDGYEDHLGLVRLRSNRAGEVVPIAPTYAGSTDPIPEPLGIGPTALAARAGRYAIGTWRDGLMIGDLVSPPLFDPSEVQQSIWQYALAFLADNQLWVTGKGVILAGDPPDVVTRSPHGASLVTLRADGSLGGVVHYARNADASDTTTITGLPSNEVRQPIVAPDGSTYLVCAAERVTDQFALDHLEGAIYDDGTGAGPRLGGVARIAADGTVTTVAGPDVTADPRAGALDETGNLWVLDADSLLVLQGGALVRVPFHLPVPAGARPLSLLLGPAQTLVAGFDRGALILLGGGGVFVGDAGFAWSAAQPSADVVLVGTDEGLVRAVAAGKSDVPVPPPGAGAPPPLHDLP